MGYTHYWERPVGSLSVAAAWPDILADVRKLVAAAPCKLSWEYDTPRKPPQLDDKAIRCNGCGDDGHETFYVERSTPRQRDWENGNKVFAFCKTARKPYDTVVCAVLAVIAERVPVFEVSSDGGEDEWRPALDWASSVLGRPVPSPLNRA